LAFSVVAAFGVGLATYVTGAWGMLATLVAFAAVLATYFCPRCVNFSCPLNRVPPTVRE
jgi:hypothetical protein